MDIIDLVAQHDPEEVVLTTDAATGLRAVIVIDSTALGPSLGGARFQPYASEQAAVTDALRLARGMTLKHAACGNEVGGGKAVIIGDPCEIKTGALLEAFGRSVARLGGRYVTAEDVGTTQEDMDLVRTVTDQVAGTSAALGGSGDPSPATAWGVYHGMRAVARELWGEPSLSGRHVALSGVGKVGAALAHLLAADGCRLSVADVRGPAALALAAELGADVVAPDIVHQLACDIFSPCALGGVLHAMSIPELRCAAVCGAANNQLATPDDGPRLDAAGILYAPDFVVNAGGVINIADEWLPGGYDRQRAFDAVMRIEETVADVLATAREEDLSTSAAAELLAHRRLAQASMPRR